MPSQAQLEQVRRDLNALSAAAASDLRRIWESFSTSERVAVGKVVDAGWLALIEQYGDIAAEIGASRFEEWAAELSIRPRTALAAGIDEARATARLGWALSTPDQMANALGLLDELVKQPYRSTVQNSALKSGGGWARVPTGSETCAWCLMLASRGGIYHTKEIAKFGTNGKKYHGDCNCQPVLVRSPEDYPEGYDPGGLYDQYQQAKKDAGYGPDGKPLSKTNRPKQGSHEDVSAVLSAMRERFDIAH